MRRYNDRILVQQVTRAENSAGQIVQTWATDTTVSPWVALDRWARCDFATGGERTLNDQRRPQSQWAIELPWDEDAANISAEMRVLFPDELVAVDLDSVSISSHGRNLMIKLTGFQDHDFDWSDLTPFPWPELDTDDTPTGRRIMRPRAFAGRTFSTYALNGS